MKTKFFSGIKTFLGCSGINQASRSVKNDDSGRWCVFTSAGDYNNVMSWLSGLKDRPWDLIVAFYGDDDSKYRELRSVAKHIFREKGSKCQNLKKLYSHNPNIFDNYDLILVSDDDFILRPIDITRLFEIAAEAGFWVCSPAFSTEGRISHDIMIWAGLESIYRTVTFLEISAPLFRADKLREFLAVYDGQLAGWGIDWWFCSHFGAGRDGRLAIIDDVVFWNPRDDQRSGGRREITKLQSDEDRRAHWVETAERIGIKEFDQKVLSQLFRTTGPLTVNNKLRAGSEFIRLFPTGRDYSKDKRPDLLRDVARIHIVLGNRDEAKRLLEIALVERSNSPWIRKLLDQLISR